MNKYNARDILIDVVGDELNECSGYYLGELGASAIIKSNIKKVAGAIVGYSASGALIFGKIDNKLNDLINKIL